eukprot:COSAG01_NODE_47938_length_385_cov_2.059441_1_plen_26_part_01
MRADDRCTVHHANKACVEVLLGWRSV